MGFRGARGQRWEWAKEQFLEKFVRPGCLETGCQGESRLGPGGHVKAWEENQSPEEEKEVTHKNDGEEGGASERRSK